MTITFWDMTYGDSLKDEILRIKSLTQRNLFYKAYLRMGEHIYKHDVDETLTFGEYYRMYEE